MITIEAMATDHTGTELAYVSIEVSTESEQASLPKSIRLNKAGCAHIVFRANGVNGGTNEAGARRVKALLKAADKAGFGVVFSTPAWVSNELNAALWGNGMMRLTRPDVEALLG